MYRYEVWKEILRVWLRLKPVCNHCRQIRMIYAELISLEFHRSYGK